MTLKEIVDRYSVFGLKDLELIKYYFQVNNIQEQAVELLTEISKDTIVKQKEYIDIIKDCSLYNQSILDNPNIDFNIKQTLINAAQSYVNNGSLDKKILDKLKSIFDNLDKDSLKCFPKYFLAYLQSEGIALEYLDMSQYRQEILERKDKF